MSNKAIRVVARFVAKADKVEALHRLAISLLEPTRKEAGCVNYQLLHNAADPTDFTFVEEWSSSAELDAHFTTPHVVNALGELGDILATPADIRRYQTLS